ncbi:MAG TPA: LptF/LptG family permease, partial [Elusimicrobiota bacterium]|nr:LptF/LptG family permease [Elusimicrobiota bacterium]
YFLSLALPMAFLVALLLTLGQLSESGEVMALRSAGYSFREMLRPYLWLSVFLSAFLLWINHKASPDGFHAFKDSYARAAAHIARVDVEPKTYLNFGEWQFYVEKSDAKTGRIEGVRLIKKKGQYGRLSIAAPEGKIEVEPGVGIALDLKSGSLVLPSDSPETSTSGTFGRYRVTISFVEPSGGPRPADMQELSTPRLREQLRKAALDEEKRRAYLAEIGLRSAGAIAPFVMFFVACPLGIRVDKRGRVAGFAISLGLIFAYYGLLAAGVSVGRKFEAAGLWGPWLPNVFCAAAGAWLWREKLSG